jgi:hypothetical protein
MPLGRGDGVLIKSGAGFMASVKVADAVLLPPSARVTLKVEDPMVVGVPLMTPLFDKVSPAGNVVPA